MAELTFNAYIINNKVEKIEKEEIIEFYKKIKSDKTEYFTFDDKGSSIAVELLHDSLKENYLFIGFRTGRDTNYSEDVLDISKLRPDQNPRKKEQVELQDYRFVYIDFIKQITLISYGAKGIFEKIITKNNYHWTLTEIRVSLEDFIQTTNIINQIRLASGKNLFYDAASVVKEVDSLQATGLNVEHYELIMDVKLTGSLKEKVIRYFTNEYSEGKYEKLVIVGDKDGSFEKIFNKDTFTHKLVIEVEYEEKSGYNYEEIIDKVKQAMDSTTYFTNNNSGNN
ncbi:hypothetical protein PT115_03370 [Erysipelothrix rhusiopathiae]|nr:hypothetical protein [Erysipelothrix rhusiopathiae]